MTVDAPAPQFDAGAAKFIPDRATFKPEEVARILGIGRTQIFAELAARRLGSFKVGRTRLVSRGAIEAWVRDREAESSASAEAAS